MDSKMKDVKNCIRILATHVRSGAQNKCILPLLWPFVFALVLYFISLDFFVRKYLLSDELCARTTIQ